MRSLFSVCPPVGPPPPPTITCEAISRFYEVRYRGHADEGDLEAVHFNAAASVVPKCRMFRLLMWMQNLHQST
jgi:hypothetical protein